MAVDLDKLNFYSGVNYMKRSDFCGNDDTASLTVSHDLGYIPFIDIHVDLNDDGILWAGGEKVHTNTDSSSGGAVNTLATYYTDDADLTVTVTAARPVYYLIYLDYGSS